MTDPPSELVSRPLSGRTCSRRPRSSYSRRLEAPNLSPAGRYSLHEVLVESPKRRKLASLKDLGKWRT